MAVTGEWVAPLRHPYSYQDLLPLIVPRTVALIGASSRADTLAAKVHTSLLSGSVAATTFAVNPRYDSLAGRPCFKSVADVPVPVDCALVAVPGAAVLPALRDCADSGVRSAIVLASGFAETGRPEGIALQGQFAAIAAKSGLRVCGPNTIGLANIRDGIESLFMPPFGDARVPGPVGLVVQSGAMAYHLLQAQHRGIGFSYGLMPGNSCDVDVLDFVNFLIDDDSTKVIALVFEGLGPTAGAGQRLQYVADRARRARKAIIALRGGTGEVSRAAALSHTGGMTGSSRAYEAAFERMGIVGVQDLDELIETARFFAVSGTARSAGASIVSLSGGAGVLSAGAAESAGVPLTPLSPETASALAKYIPEYGTIANPLDLTATVGMSDGDALVEAIRVVADDPGYGIVVVPQTVALEAVTTPRCSALRDIAHQIPVPLVVIWLSEWLEGPGSELIEADDRASLFRSARRAFAAIRSWIDWGAWPAAEAKLEHPSAEAGLQARVKVIVDAAFAAAPADVDRVVFDEAASRALLTVVGVRSADPLVAGTAEDAATAADLVGYPVVVKVLTERIVHKSRIGGVVLGVADAAGVRRAFESIRESVQQAGFLAEEFRVIVEPVVDHDVELIVGGRYDHDFRSVVMLGRGGTAVEELGESLLEIGPMGDDRALNMVKRLAGEPLANREGEVAAALQAVSKLLEADARIDEIDVNPLVTTLDDVVALDGVVTAVRAR
jgi:acyl-CoA synthetase (NDP forming)